MFNFFLVLLLSSRLVDVSPITALKNAGGCALIQMAGNIVLYVLNEFIDLDKVFRNYCVLGRH